MSVPEAQFAITRARKKQIKPALLPSKRIIDFLHNEVYQLQLEKWQASKYKPFENIIVNPTEPREKWKVERSGELLEERGEDGQPNSELYFMRYILPLISEEPHRLSIIEEGEEEAHRLSAVMEATEEATEE